MTVSVNSKSKFAFLKYEQMLTEKYFIETCFSKKYESNPPRETLQDLRLLIKLNNCK